MEYEETFRDSDAEARGAKDPIGNQSRRLDDDRAQFVVCHYDTTRALCHPDMDGSREK